MAYRRRKIIFLVIAAIWLISGLALSLLDHDKYREIEILFWLAALFVIGAGLLAYRDRLPD